MAKSTFVAVMAPRERRPEMRIMIVDGPGTVQEYDGTGGGHYPSWSPALPLVLRPAVDVIDAEGLDCGLDMPGLSKPDGGWTLKVDATATAMGTSFVTDDSASTAPAGLLKVTGDFLGPGQRGVLTYSGVWTDPVTGIAHQLQASIALECRSVTPPRPRAVCDRPASVIFNPLTGGPEAPVTMTMFSGGKALAASGAGRLSDSAALYGFRWYVANPGSDDWEEYVPSDSDPRHADMTVAADTRSAVIRTDRMPSGCRVKVTGWVRLDDGTALETLEAVVLDYVRQTTGMQVSVEGAPDVYRAGQRVSPRRAVVRDSRGRVVADAAVRMAIVWRAGAGTAGKTKPTAVIARGAEAELPLTSFSTKYGGVYEVEVSDPGPKRIVTSGGKALTSDGKVIIA